VDVEHLLELLVGHLVDRRVDRVAGVVDDDVDLAEGVDRGLDQPVGRVAGGEVAGEDGGLAGDLFSRLLGDVAVEVVDQNLSALRAEPVTIAALPSSTPIACFLLVRGVAAGYPGCSASVGGRGRPARLQVEQAPEDLAHDLVRAAADRA
jgi:hypothetical protein